MKTYGLRGAAATLACFGLVCAATAQRTSRPAYLNPTLPAAQRAANLVSQMTLQEKASQMVNQARAIPRLHVSAYDWRGEALHGLAVKGTTEFPEPIALAATFDAPAIHQMATAVSIEARIKHAQAVRANGGHSDRGQGLDFWAPNINIFRDPRWGRGQETYGEDPFLTGRMAVAFVTGMQGDDPNYYRIIATPKHFDVHSGPELTRHEADVNVSKHDEMDTYLPAFRAAVVEGKADSVMCAYNRINGEPACANQFLLQDQLRDKWGFKGYVVSDCDSVQDIYSGHHYEPSMVQAVAVSVSRGMDNECIDPIKVNDDHDYRPYIEAVQQGYLKVADLDKALIRLFTARIKLGMFDPVSMVPYAHIDESQLNSPAHRALALKLANESMVLLKNDGLLPLKTSGQKILVVGPLATQTGVMLGNFSGIPTHPVSILEGIRKEFAGDAITYAPGTGFLSQQTEPVPNSLLTTDGRPGVAVTYTKQYVGAIFEDDKASSSPAPLAKRFEQQIELGAQPLPAAAAHAQQLIVRWEATLTPTETGYYELGVKTDGMFRLRVNGKDIADADYVPRMQTVTGRIQLDAGTHYQLLVEYGRTTATPPSLELLWHRIDRSIDPGIVAQARKADVVVAVVGITSTLEGEESQIDEPGFKGGDRTRINLPEPEEKLLQTLATAGKPLAVVLTNGSALAVNWASTHASAILDAWYPGEEGGDAVAQTLSGRNDPGGRLPVTFYTGVDQLPPFDDYSMKSRTYRYFHGKPLYPFGYGLSYTTFDYRDLTLPQESIKAGDPLNAEVTVTNTGKRAGEEVAQLYLKFPPVPGAPLKALRGFARVHLQPGASKKVTFKLDPRAMSMVTEAGEPIVAAGEYIVSIGGGQPGTEAPVLTGHFNVEGSLTLPE